jgi:uncharacterized protein YneF (UPF0154 family)
MNVETWLVIVGLNVGSFLLGVSIGLNTAKRMIEKTLNDRRRKWL